MSSVGEDGSDVSDGNMNCVVKPVFHNFNITFTYGK